MWNLHTTTYTYVCLHILGIFVILWKCSWFEFLGVFRIFGCFSKKNQPIISERFFLNRRAFNIFQSDPIFHAKAQHNKSLGHYCSQTWRPQALSACVWKTRSLHKLPLSPSLPCLPPSLSLTLSHTRIRLFHSNWRLDFLACWLHSSSGGPDEFVKENAPNVARPVSCHN
jgi:hypothetical protein